MRNKIVSILLSIFLLLSTQNVSVLAIEEGTSQGVEQTEEVIEETEESEETEREESSEEEVEESEEPEETNSSVDESENTELTEVEESQEESIEESEESSDEEINLEEEATPFSVESNSFNMASAKASKPTNHPEGYESPEFEEGKINVNGYYVVASDGQLSEYLEWSFPYRNPLQEEGIYPDPGRPYRYVMWQAKKNANGAWGNWETRSPVDVDAKDGSVWVLNVAPDTIAGSQNLKNWMNTPIKDYDGTMTTIGRGVINVRTISVTAFNNNPAGELKIDPVSGEATNEYQYSVIVFGTCDSNGGQDITAAAYDETVKFYEAGGGLMLGHDTVRTSSPNFTKFAAKDFLNITSGGAVTVGHSTSGNAYVKVVDTGFLTSRPWNLEGKTLTIPNTHVLGQRVGGVYSDPTGSQPRVWMQLSDASGNVNSVPSTNEPPFTHVLASGYLETNNYYLITNGRIAMIQTGHSNGLATVDEEMVIANTLIYLAQSTTTTTAKDTSFIDEAKPSKAQGKVTAVTPTADLMKYTATIELSGSVDYGTEYAYRIQALPQTTISDGSDYNEIWSTTATDPMDDSVYRDLALSGLRGYYIGAVNNSPTPMVLNSVDASKVISASGSEDKISVETGELVPGNTYYVHAYAVDYQGNVSEDMVIEIAVSARVVNFHFNDEENKVSQTLLKSDGTCATMPSEAVREGYRFLGWFTEEGKEVNETSSFDESYGDEIEVYAKWIKTWKVTMGQRGEGEVSVSSTKGEKNPFDEGSDVIVSYEASEGYEVKSVWLDGVEYQPNENGKLLIKNIEADHYVLVEFEAKEEGNKPVYEYYSIETELTGGGSLSKITPSVRMEKQDARCTNYEVKWEIASGYEVREVIVDGIDRRDLVDENQIRFAQVRSDHKIQVIVERKEKEASQFEVKTELIGGPGEITPSKEVKSGESMTVESRGSDERNYEIVSTKVFDKNGADVSSRYGVGKGTVTLTNIQEDLRVVVELQAKKQAGTVVIAQKDLLKVETSKSGEGEISGSKILKRGESETVSWSAAEGWKITEVIVDEEKIYYREKEEPMARAFSMRVEEEGEVPFEEIEENHSVHVTFEREYEEKEADRYEVKTALVGDGVGRITSGNSGLEGGEDYEIEWETEENHEVIEVWVNGELREELKEAGRYEIKNIDQDYEVIVVVKRTLNIDTDGDGKPDVNVDTDGDGKPDVNIDTDGDDEPDINIVDQDGDGKPDNIDPEDKEQEKKPNVNVDTDGDGKPDVNIDTDKDGKPDINIVDKDKDGKPDHVDPKDPNQDKEPDVNIVDKDGDGKADDLDDLTKEELEQIKPDINIDTTGDGRPNVNIDTNGDGKADINIDTDGDGVADTNIDADGNGLIDAEEFQAAVNTGDESETRMWMMSMLGAFMMMVLILKRRRQVQ